jgi:hypothetical protein
LKKFIALMKNNSIMEKMNPKLDEKFRLELIYENTRRLLILLCCVILFEILFILSQVIGLIKWNPQIVVFQFSVIVICSILGVLIYYSRKKEKIIILTITTMICI